MDNPNPHSFLDGLVYEDHLALQWNTIEARPDAIERVVLEDSNLEILRTVFALGDYYAESVDEPVNVAQELTRLDFKLNLVLDLVGEVLSYYHELPPRIPVRLGAQGIQWEAAQAPPPQGLVSIELYLNVRYPRALRLIGRVQSVTPLAQGLRSVVMFEDIGEAAQDMLEKIIFRHHRRSIALARRNITPH
ncbi:MAG: PilZ domain-containing protein [Gammaproteobacteria bacterium]|nr:PilZ domain-containing protein [Gammaproteobacteria bacterium]